MAKLVGTKGVRRIIIVRADGSSARLQGKKKRKKRKTKGLLRPIERVTRRMLQAGDVGTSELLKRHNRSSRRSKRRFITDSPKTLSKANWKAFKKVRRIRFL